MSANLLTAERNTKPKHQMRFVYVWVTLVAVVIAHVAFWWGHQGLYWDSAAYFYFAQQIAKDGLFNFSNDTRTFGYPLFLALVWVFSESNSATLQFLAFFAQLWVLLLACMLAVRVFSSLFLNSTLTRLLFTMLILNPLMLVYTGVVLSDLLSAVLIFASVLLSIAPLPRPDSHIQRSHILLRQALLAVGSFFLLGCATMVRPADFIVVVAVGLVWILRFFKFHEGTPALWLVMLVAFCLPFFPQVVNNYRTYGKFQPLVVRSLYYDQLNWGIQYLRLSSVTLPDEKHGVGYVNPFWSPRMATITDFFRERPLEFITTQGIHLFALFQQDYVYPYITVLKVWYTLPIAVANGLFLFGSLSGIAVWIIKGTWRKTFRQLDLALAGMLLSSVAYVSVYALGGVDSRYSLPVYWLLAPFFVYGFGWVRDAVSGHHCDRVAYLSMGLVAFWGTGWAFSCWLQSQVQVPLVEGVRKSVPSALEDYRTWDIQSRFGNSIELVRYGFDRADPQGGDALFTQLMWLADDAMQGYIVQVDLIDSKDRIWSRGMNGSVGELVPCITGCLQTQKATEVFVLQLPVTIPPGEYMMRVSVYDPTTDKYLLTPDQTGRTGENWQIAKLEIGKNKDSFTASDLAIENRLYVDMREMRLLGFPNIDDRVYAGNDLSVGLYWRARAKPQGDYEVAVQLRDKQYAVAYEQSSRPADGAYPTTEWDMGEVLLDWHTVSVPKAMLEGDYSIFVVLRDVSTKHVLGEANIASTLVMH
jgi:hypothetical protein